MTRLTSALLLAGTALALPSAATAFTLEPVTTHQAGSFDEGASEIVAFDPASKQFFVVNGETKSIDILMLKDGALEKTGGLEISKFGKAPNSVAVKNGHVAIAVEAGDAQADGKLVLYKTDGTLVGAAATGALPDMVTFTPDGTMAITANEGQPNDAFDNDPEGTVSFITVPGLEVTTVGFGDLTEDMLSTSVHLPAPEGTSVAQNLEPEYIGVSKDGSKAFVALQENNALAVFDVASKSLEAIHGLGLVDFMENEFDLSDKDGAYAPRTAPVKSFRQPDSIAVVELGGETYIVTANEGDARDYDGYSEETRVEDLKLDANAFPNAAELQDRNAIGRLKATTARGDTDGDGDHDEIYAFGGRAFSIFSADGELVFDPGDSFEKKLHEAGASHFNSQGVEASFDNRSDDKGAEPEGLAVGEIDGKTYAFIGLERMGGIMVYDITVPAASAYVGYFNNAIVTGDPEAGTAGDIAPEGLTFIPAADSPTGENLLAVANEVSGTTTLFAVRP